MPKSKSKPRKPLPRRVLKLRSAAADKTLKATDAICATISPYADAVRALLLCDILVLIHGDGLSIPELDKHISKQLKALTKP